VQARALGAPGVGGRRAANEPGLGRLGALDALGARGNGSRGNGSFYFCGRYAAAGAAQRAVGISAIVCIVGAVVRSMPVPRPTRAPARPRACAPPGAGSRVFARVGGAVSPKARNRAACPISTGWGTRRVHLVREGGAAAGARHAGLGPRSLPRGARARRTGALGDGRGERDAVGPGRGRAAAHPQVRDGPGSPRARLRAARAEGHTAAGAERYRKRCCSARRRVVRLGRRRACTSNFDIVRTSSEDARATSRLSERGLDLTRGHARGRPIPELITVQQQPLYPSLVLAAHAVVLGASLCAVCSPPLPPVQNGHVSSIPPY